MQQILKKVCPEKLTFTYRIVTVSLLAYGQIADSDRTAIVVDAPTVLLDAIDALGIGTDIIDVEHKYGVVGIDIDMIRIVSWTFEPVTVYSFNETFACGTFLLEIEFAVWLQVPRRGKSAKALSPVSVPLL